MQDYLCVGAMVLAGICAVAVFISVGTFVNRAIGSTYDAKAAQLRQRIAPFVVREGKQVPLRMRANNAFSIQWRWGTADAWLTRGVLYLAPSRRVFGKPIGAPLIGIALGVPEKHVEGVSFVVRLVSASVDARGRLYVVAKSPTPLIGVTYRVRLAVDDASAWVAEIAAARETVTRAPTA